MTVPERWNYYFQRCRAVSATGATVALPGGHGMVVAEELADQVYFPATQTALRLIPGEVARLVKLGLAERYGKVRPDKPAAGSPGVPSGVV